MTLQEILTDGGGILIIALTLIQISPIKINPWTSILRFVGRCLNGEVMDELREYKADSARYRILRFNDEIMHGHDHTKEHFDQILDDITNYEKYCASHPNYKNNKAVMAIDNIKETYRNCTINNTFL